MTMNTFNKRSLELINNIYNNMSRHYPQYNCYINKEDVSYSISIEILNGNNYVNKYYFYPNVISGNIESQIQLTNATFLINYYL
jgi:hypothetical protein